MSPAAAWPETSREKCGPPASLSLLLPNIKLTSTPTQQHGRPSLRDRSHTAGDASAGGTAAPSGRGRRVGHTHHPARGVCPCGCGRWDRSGEEERRGGRFMEKKKKTRARASVCRIFRKADLFCPLLVKVPVLQLISPHVSNNS